MSFGQTAYVFAKSDKKVDSTAEAQTIVDFLNYNAIVQAKGGEASPQAKKQFVKALKEYIQKNDFTHNPKQYETFGDTSPGV